MDWLHWILIVVAVAGIGVGAWFFVVRRFRMKDTARDITDAVKRSRQ